MRLSSCTTASFLVLVFAGCSALEPLRQPPQVPVYLDTYDTKHLFEHTYDVCCSLNLGAAVEKAAVGVKGVSGATAVGQEYPIRDIMQTEFESVINRNFKPVVGSEQPHVEMKVQMLSSILTLDGDRYRYVFSVSVILQDPRHIERPYFSKIYKVNTSGYRHTEAFVPVCVYEAVQRVIGELLMDLEADESFAACLDNLTP